MSRTACRTANRRRGVAANHRSRYHPRDVRQRAALFRLEPAMTWRATALALVAGLLVAACSSPPADPETAQQPSAATAPSEGATSEAPASEASEAAPSEAVTEEPTDEASEETQTAGVVPAKMWVNDFCGSINSWVGGIQDDNRKFTKKLAGGSSNPAQVKRVLVEFLSNTVEANEELRADLDAAGIPDVARGDQLIRQLNGALDEAFARFEQTLQRARDLPTGNRQKFLAALNRAEAPLNGIQEAFSIIERDFDKTPGGRRLARLLERAPDCA